MRIHDGDTESHRQARSRREVQRRSDERVDAAVLLQPDRRDPQRFDFLDHARDYLAMLLAQRPVDFDEAVVDVRVVTDQAVRGNEAAEPRLQRMWSQH